MRMGKIEQREDQVVCQDHSGHNSIWQCDVCGKKMCEECKAVGFNHKIYCDVCIEKVDLTPKQAFHPAGFWKRLAARLLDTLILGILNLFIWLIVIFFFSPILFITGAVISYLIYVACFTIIPMKVGQTPGKMAMEIEIVTRKGKLPGFFNMFFRHILGFTVGFFYVLGMIIFYNGLTSGMGTEHITSAIDFLKEYHRFGLSDTMVFFYCLLGIVMLAESVFIFFTKLKLALHDMWAGTRVIINL